jgi:hypothetical protein
MDKNILSLIVVLILISIIIRATYESYYEMYPTHFYNYGFIRNSAICFITRNLDPNLLKFAESCSVYNDTYIIVDDNEQVIEQDKSSKVKIIQINNDECKNNYYIRSTSRFNLDVTGWDKALYYFCENNIYDNVWFIEDDVFIPKPNTLYMIDITENKTNNHDWNNKINKVYLFLNNRPVFWSWVCAMRCSQKLLKLIKTFKIEHNQLYFHEMLIPSLVKLHNLKYIQISELIYIVYRREYNDSDIIKNSDNLYHPIKDYDRHEKLRLKIQDKSKGF